MDIVNSESVELNKSHAFIIFDARAKCGDARASARVGPGLATPLFRTRVSLLLTVIYK